MTCEARDALSVPFFEVDASPAPLFAGRAKRGGAWSGDSGGGWPLGSDLIVGYVQKQH